MKRAIGAVAALAVVLALTVGLAEVHADATPVQSSTATLSDKYSVLYFGQFSGPSVGAVNGNTTASDGSLSKPQKLTSLLTAGVKLTSDILVGAAAEWNTMPVNQAGFQLKPPMLRAIYNNVLHSTRWILVLDLRLYAPIGEVAQKNHILTGLRSTQNLTYNVPNSKWSVGNYSFVRTWAFENGGVGDDFEFVVAPYVRYSLSPSLAATFQSDLIQLNLPHSSSLGMQSASADVQGGIKWDITSTWSLNPYLNMIPAHLALDSTTLGMLISGKFL